MREGGWCRVRSELREGGKVVLRRVVMRRRVWVWRRQWIPHLHLDGDCCVWNGLGPHYWGWLMLYSKTHSRILCPHSMMGDWCTYHQMGWTSSHSSRSRYRPFWNRLRTSHHPLWNGLQTCHRPLWNRLRTCHNPLWNGLQTCHRPLWNRLRTYHRSLWNGLWTCHRPLWNRLWTCHCPLWNRLWTCAWTILLGTDSCQLSCRTS